MTSTTARRRGPAGWTLRTRLLAALLALLAVTSVVIGLVSVLVLDSSLRERLDGQLTAAVGRSRSAEGPHSESGDRPSKQPGPPGLFAPGQAQGTLSARVSDGIVTDAGVLDSTGAAQSLSAGQNAVVSAVPADGRPHTRDLGGTLGQYRLVAASTEDGDVLVTGLPLGEVKATVYQLAAIITAVAGLGLLVATLSGAAIIRLTLRPLRRVATTATRVSELPLDRGEVALAVRVPESDTDPRTEVGQVGAALNRMLGHVTAALNLRHASETQVRQFVADASHELRTPLAAIRGYAELARRSRDQVPPDIAHALRRVESEAGRMTTLVEELLLLARLDAGRPLDHRPLDLSRLVVDAVSDAHAAGPNHRWHLDLPDEPVIVTGDSDSLHQVVANLLANARSHTPAGTAVTVALAAHRPNGAAPTADDIDASPGEVVFSVVDDGPGIPADLLPHVFERFARGDSSRSRAAGSTGLGLAIVAAVIEAHHGRADVTSQPGRTAFTLRLPLDRTTRP
jgi:two-component system, OmpR family, sensor kinase